MSVNLISKVVNDAKIPLPFLRWKLIDPPGKPGKTFGFEPLDDLGGMMLDVSNAIDIYECHKISRVRDKGM